ncbi:cap-specific mRNA (nucleoside-2'-O-)-methyltransferase 2 isoform X2 [Cephus cinctus]|nr:cap-specific mRNA (nucleoside-2'-O-)-methyltransferase 2 isoform X2 [Cephus cinctus]
MLRSQLPKDFGTSHCTRFLKRPRELDVQVEKVISELFNKRFSIVNNGQFTIPKPEYMFMEKPWKTEALQQLKEELNETKSRLNDYNLLEWHRHTGQRNQAGDVHWKLRMHIDPEFLTQAWCKFYENVSSFPLVPEQAIADRKFTSVHLCEAPGAFVTSLNHWLKSNQPAVEWDWIATTLNPYYEGNPLSRMITDDRFILHTLDHWCFGADNTGNLMDINNLDNLVEMTKSKDKIMLVTADGSIDCLDTPGEQETVVSHLHYCETVAAIHILQKGGSFLLKIFTIFEHTSVCLTYLLCCLFDRVFINKPVTSKEGNSEVYMICLGFKGPEYAAPYLNILRKHYTFKSDMAMFRRNDIPDTIIKQIFECGKFFMDHQCKVISNNISSFNSSVNDTKPDFTLRHIRRAVALHFLQEYNLRKLDSEEEEIVGKTKLARTNCMNFDAKKQYFSYNERLKRKDLEPKSRLMAFAEDLHFTEVPISSRWIQRPETLGVLSIRMGKPFRKIQSSKYCAGEILKVLNATFEIAETLQLQLRLPTEKSVQEFCEKPNNEYSKNILHFQYTNTENGINDLVAKIREKVLKLPKGESLVLIGYCLLTQFYVGLLYVISHNFEYLEFMIDPKLGCVIILKSNLAMDNVLEKLKEISLATETAKDNGNTVLSVLPVTELCGAALYPYLMQINHWLVKYCIDYVAEMVKDNMDN